MRANLPPAPALVLEVGAGDGELARSLRESGYAVTAIDPKSESPDVEPVALADLPEPRAAVRRGCRGRLAAPRRAARGVGRAARRGDGAAGAAPARRVRRRRARRARGRVVARAAPRARRRRAGDAGRARSQTMRAQGPPDRAAARRACHRWFEVGEPLRGTYLYRWKLDETLREGGALVAAGELPPTGVRIIARRRARPRRAARPRRGPAVRRIGDSPAADRPAAHKRLADCRSRRRRLHRASAAVQQDRTTNDG